MFQSSARLDQEAVFWEPDDANVEELQIVFGDLCVAKDFTTKPAVPSFVSCGVNLVREME